MSDKRLIDRDELLKHEVMIITKGNATFSWRSVIAYRDGPGY